MELPVLLIVAALATLTNAVFRVELHPVYNKMKHHTGYAVKVNIGTPGKAFNVLLETVSSNLWVAGIDCIDLISPFCVGKTKYSKNESSTHQYDGLLWLQMYGMQRVASNGYVWKDKVSVDLIGGGFLQDSVGFRTPAVIHWIGWEQYQNIDGVIGLGLPDAFNVLDPMHAVHAALSNLLVTIALPSLDRKKAAVLTIDGFDSDSCDGRKAGQEAVVSAGSRYDFEVSSIQLGHTTMVFTGIKAVAYPHVSKPYIGVPEQFMQQIAQDLNAKKDPTTGIYKVNCHQDIGPFVLRTAKHVYTVEPHHFIINRNKNDEQCELAFNTRQGFGNSIALGLPFFHQYCVILESCEKLISFTANIAN